MTIANAERPAMPCPNPGRHKAGQGWSSLSTRGAWGQVAIAATLISVLPSLILLWLWETRDTGSTPLGVAILAGCLGLALGILGYTLLLKYPASITRLRRYLQDIALDRLPDRVELCHDEDDINAIRQCLEQIVIHAEERIRLLEEKQAATLAAERHRIMHESIGALCHHVGQPAAALGITLHLMQQGSPPPPLAALIAESQQSFNAMTDILDRLRDLTHYQTEPYLVSDPAGPRIIQVPSGNISDSKPVTLPTTDLTKPVSPARLRDLVSSRSVTG